MNSVFLRIPVSFCADCESVAEVTLAEQPPHQKQYEQQLKNIHLEEREDPNRRCCIAAKFSDSAPKSRSEAPKSAHKRSGSCSALLDLQNGASSNESTPHHSRTCILEAVPELRSLETMALKVTETPGAAT